ncbi:MAG: energy transducer TonB [Alphaproteobacteria bacterium]|nr:energy transducer TonB [Alphaproteobacteria bacterium]
MMGKRFPKLQALTSLLLLGASVVPQQAGAEPHRPSDAEASKGERVADVLLLEAGGDRDPGLIRSPAPLEGVRQWVSAADYPEAARREAREAQIFLEIAVDAAGRATGCRVAFVQGAAGADFEKQACAVVMSRGRFRHGLDAEGNARPGTVRMVMTFSLRDPSRPPYWPPPPPGPIPGNVPPRLIDPGGRSLTGAPDLFPNRHPAAFLDVDGNGRVTRCQISQSAGTDAGDAAVCRHVSALRFEPARELGRNRIAYQNYFVRLDVE